MSKLSPEARSLFDAAQGGDGPSVEDRARVRAKLAARLGAGVVAGTAIGSTVASGSAAAGAKVAGFAPLVKLLFTAAVIGGLGSGAYVATRDPQAPPTVLGSAALASRGSDASDRAAREVAALAEQSEQALDAPAEPSGAREEPTGASSSSPIAAAPITATSARTDRSNRPPPRPVSSAPVASGDNPPPAAAAPAGGGPAAPAAPPSRSALEEETALLGEAQAALRHGKTDEALRALDRHSTKFGSGALRDERLGTRILTLCAAGRIEEARAEAARFLRESPRSPMAARVRASCAGK